MELNFLSVVILLTIFINFVIFLLTLRKYIQTRIRGVLFLCCMNFFVAAFEYSNFLLYAVPELSTWQLSYVGISYTFPILMGWFFVLFLESFSEEKLMGTKTAVSMFFLGGMFAGIWFFPLASIVLVVGTYYIIVTIWSYRVLNTTLYYINDEEVESQIKRMKVGLLIAFLGTAMGYSVTVAVGQFESTLQEARAAGNVLPHILLAIGTIYIGLSYLAHPRLAVVQPQKMHKLFVILDSGLPLFSYEFASDVRIDDTLISGALNAITNLMTEAVGVNESLDMVKFGDRVLLVSIQKNIAGILITDEPTAFLREGLRKFMERFIAQYEDVIPKWTGNPDVFRKAHDIIQRVFGIRVESRQKVREVTVI